MRQILYPSRYSHMQGRAVLSNMVCNAGPTGWRVTQHGGHGWQRECPALTVPGLEHLPPRLPSLDQAKPEQLVALASSSRWCEIMQVGDWVLGTRLVPGLRVVLHDVPSRLIPVGYGASVSACAEWCHVDCQWCITPPPSAGAYCVILACKPPLHLRSSSAEHAAQLHQFQARGLHSMLTAQRSSGQFVACQHDMPPAEALAQ